MIALSQEEADFMRKGLKINAIKALRDRTFMSLREAKDYVEGWDGRTILTKEIEEKNRQEGELRIYLLGVINGMDSGQIGTEEGLKRMKTALLKPH